jgi:hypothetical protein
MTKTLLSLSLLLPGLLAGAILPASAARAETVKIAAYLFSAELTEPGPPEASGEFQAEIDPALGDVCYTLAVAGVPKALGGHIHTGKSGEDGPELVALDVTGVNNKMCLTAEPASLRAIVANPSGYYVNVYNRQFPTGAVRGQIVLP